MAIGQHGLLGIRDLPDLVLYPGVFPRDRWRFTASSASFVTVFRTQAHGKIAFFRESHVRFPFAGAFWL